MPSRLASSVRNIIRNEFPNYTFQGVYEYAIQRVDGNFVDVDPTDTTLGLPHISHAELRPSILGETVAPTVGSLVIVAFVNGNGTRPVVLSVIGPDVSLSVSATSSVSVDAPQIAIGGSAVSVNLGPLPQTLAHGPGTVAAFDALLAYVAAVTTLASTPPTSVTFPLFATAIATAGATLATALAAATATIPTTVVKGT